MNKFFLLPLVALTIHYLFLPTAWAAEFTPQDLQIGILNLTADHFAFSHETGTITYTGNVSATLNQRQLTCDELVIYRNMDDSGNINKIIAKGQPAQLKGTLAQQPTLIAASAKIMEFDMHKQIFYLRGDARVERGQDVYTAPEIKYDIAHEIISSTASRQQRTHITIDHHTLENHPS